MKHSPSLLAGALLAAAVALFAGRPTGAQSQEQPGVVDGPECLTVSGVAIYRSGYSHIVRVRNQCSGTAHCQVSTSVDPTPTHHLAIPAGQTREQTTRIGSPSYTFQARATCTVEASGGGSGGSGPS